MSHLVIGAGPVGRAVASHLAARGEEVVLGSRSGQGPALHGIRRARVDAGSVEALLACAPRRSAIYNCVNPPHYDRWAEDWPPLAAALLAAAEQTGAVLATVGNLYPYGRPDGQMTEGQPDAPTETKGQVRAVMTAATLEAHRAGRVRAVEVRASDYVGAGVSASGHVPRVVPAALRGKTAWVVGATDQPHTWTDVDDVARALVRGADLEAAHGHVWHAPSNAPRTQAQAVSDICRVVGRPAPRVRALPLAAVRGLGLASPVLREIARIAYQFTQPYVMSSTRTSEVLGLEATPWEQVCERTARSALIE